MRKEKKMRESEVKIQRLHPAVNRPAYATPGACGMDVCACIDAPLTIQPGERVRVPTGFALAMPQGMVCLVFARSGLAHREGLALSNGVGVIDSDYRGEVLVAVVNLGKAPLTLIPGERFAQIGFFPYYTVAFKECDSLPSTERGGGGFGSTGTGGCACV